MCLGGTEGEVYGALGISVIGDARDVTLKVYCAAIVISKQYRDRVVA